MLEVLKLRPQPRYCHFFCVSVALLARPALGRGLCACPQVSPAGPGSGLRCDVLSDSKGRLVVPTALAVFSVVGLLSLPPP